MPSTLKRHRCRVAATQLLSGSLLQLANTHTQLGADNETEIYIRLEGMQAFTFYTLAFMCTHATFCLACEAVWRD